MDLPARIQIPELLLWYRQGVLKLRELITRTYRLDEINRGYADLDAGRNLRGVVVFDHYLCSRFLLPATRADPKQPVQGIRSYVGK